MRAITKIAVAAGVCAVIWVGVHNLPKAEVVKTAEGEYSVRVPATSSTPAPSPSPSASSTPTEPAMTAALSTPYQPPLPPLWQSPPPPTEEQVREMVRKEMDEAYRRGQEAERLRRAAEPAGVPPNPFETEEDRALRARKYGFQLQRTDGSEWGRIHRTDGDDIVKGLLPDTTAIETKARPVVTEKDGVWTVTFEPVPEAKP